MAGPPKLGDANTMFDRQLLAVWLNLANGSVRYLQMLDTNDDGIGDTAFVDFITEAEALRASGHATRQQLLSTMHMLEAINEGSIQ